MKITKSQLRRVIREQVEEAPPEESGPNPMVQTILDQMEDMSVDDLRVIWKGVVETSRRKQNELKVGLKKGTRVVWTHTHTGKEITGTVVRRGGKFVMVQPDTGDTRERKKLPSSLRIIE